MSEMLWQTTLQGIRDELRQMDRSGFIARSRVDHYTRHNADDRVSFGSPSLEDDDDTRPGSGYWVSGFQNVERNGWMMLRRVYPAVMRQYWYDIDGQADRIARYRFTRLTGEAGEMLSSLPGNVCEILWRDWPADWNCGTGYRAWMNAMCELGYRNRVRGEFPGSPLRIGRYAVLRGLSVELPGLNGVMNALQVPQHIREDVRSDIWYAKIDNAVSASIQMIDLLIHLGTRTRPESPPVPDPPAPETIDPVEAFCEHLSTHRQKTLFRYLANHQRSVSWDSLPPDAFRNDPPSDDAIQKALKRLQQRLSELHELFQMELAISPTGRQARLMRPRTN